MRRRVIEDDRATACTIDARIDARARAQRRAAPTPDVRMKHATEFDGVADLEAAVRVRQYAAVTDLAAGLGVERRAVEQHDRVLAIVQRVARATVAHDRERLAA